MPDATSKTEQARLAKLRDYALLDTPPEPPFDDLVRLAAQVCDVPVALITLIDERRQWFKARVGVDICETDRDIAFCKHAIVRPDEMLMIPDARLDPRVRDNPLVTGTPNVRFYAGVPLTTTEGLAMGTLCVVDTRPRELSQTQAETLGVLARQVVSQMELRRSAAENARLCNEARIASRRATHDATHDALTGLPNRTLFSERVGACLERSRDDYTRRYAVLFIDLDRFKVVNDSLGHAAGDLLISTVARRLSNSFSADPAVAAAHTVARFGGDEFVVLLDELPADCVVEDVVRRALKAIEKPFHFGGSVIHTGASVGIVIGPREYARPDDLLRDADAALYQAKAIGRGQMVVFDARMHEQAVKRLNLEGELRHAVERDELLLHYQPVVSLATQMPIGVEALVRWKRDGKLVPPGDFIPIAEETGLIVPVGRWVLAEAVRQAAAWRTANPDLPPFKMAVNVSRRQLEDPDLVPLVRTLLSDHAIDPATLMIEITESVIMGDADDARRVLSELRALGVRLAMDDFGTGYSSLSCLHEFDLDVLKVDRSFVADIGYGREAAVVKAVIKLAQALGMSVVAEGIETPEQAAFLRTNGCDFGQGYLFARPLPAADAGAFLTGGFARAAVA